MRKSNLFFLLLFAGSLVNNAISQENELNVFCSVQTMFFNQNILEKRTVTFLRENLKRSFDTSYSSNSFAMHQMDIFMSKTLTDNLDAFVDLEFTLNYSSANKWGSFSVQEAWFNYKPDNYLNLKVGLLFPTFNNFNAVKNRLFLLPYIIRPLIYEQSLSTSSIYKEYAPDQAFIQLSGSMDIKNFRFDYAGYIGNSSSSFISSNANNSSTPSNNPSTHNSGLDTKNLNAKLLGGRIGIRTSNETFKFGVSFTSDHSNQSDSVFSNGKILAPFGDVPRYRMGSDLKLSFGNFEFDSEFIKVFYNTPEYSSTKLGLSFINANLLYNFTEKIFGLVGIQRDENEFYSTINNSFYFIAGYKFNDYLVGKLQFHALKQKPMQFQDYMVIMHNEQRMNYFAAAVSLYF